MQALILAGGLGTRLRAVVADRPKPMAPAGDAPFLAHQVAFLRGFGVDHVVLCVGYMHAQVQAYFGDGAAWGLSIDYSIEATPLGTGGALKLAEPFVDERFLLLNGDSFFDIDVAALMHAHRVRVASDPRALGTLALAEVDDPRAFGSVGLAADGRVTSFEEKASAEKPVKADKSTHFINAGIYALEQSVMNSIPAARPMSLERDVFPAVLNRGDRLYGYPERGFFVDIGTPQGYAAFLRHIGESDDDHPKQGAVAPQLRGGRDGRIALRGGTRWDGA